jgi:hypothetical protein
VLSGCSVSKTSINRIARPASSIKMEEIRKRNLSNEDFSIQKAEIDANVNGENVKFIASVKYKNEGKWMLSLKSNTGIEAVRALITSDTVLINDRFHKKLYYGNSTFIEKKYGIPVAGLPVLLGDFIETDGKEENSGKCNEGINEQTLNFGNLEAKYVISCKEFKTVRTNIINPGKGEVQIYFSKLKEVENRKFPAKISVKDSEDSIGIKINIKKIEFKNIENFDFIPGKGYEKILIK